MFKNMHKSIGACREIRQSELFDQLSRRLVPSNRYGKWSKLEAAPGSSQLSLDRM